MTSVASCVHGLPPAACAICNNSVLERPTFMGRRQTPPDEGPPRLVKGRDKVEWQGKGETVERLPFDPPAPLPRPLAPGDVPHAGLTHGDHAVVMVRRGRSQKLRPVKVIFEQERALRPSGKMTRTARDARSKTPDSTGFIKWKNGAPVLRHARPQAKSASMVASLRKRT